MDTDKNLPGLGVATWLREVGGVHSIDNNPEQATLFHQKG